MSLPPAPTAPEGARPWRWAIIGLIFLRTVVNYFDRLALPKLAPVLCAEFFITFSTGRVVDHFSYTPILIAAALLAPLATGSLFLLAGRVRQIEIR